MENEEKGGCCDNKGKCDHSIGNCCHNWKKCHMMRKIIMLIIIIIAFCLGTQWGEMRGEYRGGDRLERGSMMNWGYGKLYNEQAKTPENTSGSVTVQVNKAASVAPTPAQ